MSQDPNSIPNFEEWKRSQAAASGKRPALLWGAARKGHRHQGEDFGGATGEPVAPDADGEVIFAGPNGNMGNTVTVRHDDGFLSRYGHLNKITTQKGARVTRGDELGELGSTGNAKGPHVHYETFTPENLPVNPRTSPYRQPLIGRATRIAPVKHPEPPGLTPIPTFEQFVQQQTPTAAPPAAVAGPMEPNARVSPPAATPAVAQTGAIAPPSTATSTTPAPTIADRAMPAFQNEVQEQKFQQWYGEVAKERGLNPNPDDPRHQYDYRAAFLHDSTPDPQSGHWPSQFKLAKHPNRYVDGKDTITGQPDTRDLATKAGDSRRRGVPTPKPEDVIVQQAVRNPDKLQADLLWHYGPNALDDFQTLNNRDKRKMILFATQQAARDEVKKSHGAVLTEDAEYQAKMRGRIAALKNRPQTPKAATGVGFGDVHTFEGQEQEVQRIIKEELANAESSMPLRERLIARGFTHKSADQIAAMEPQPRGPITFTAEQKQLLSKLRFDEDDQRRIAEGGYPKGVTPPKGTHKDRVRAQLTKNVRLVVADELNLKSRVKQGVGTTGVVEGASNDAPNVPEFTANSPEVHSEAAMRVEAMMLNPNITNMPLRSFEPKTLTGWLDDFKRASLGEKARDVARVLPFVGQGVQIGEALRVYSLAKKLEAGKATESEKRELAYFQVESTREGSTQYQVASIVAQLPAFATELALTGGAYSAGKKTTARILGRVTENAIAEKLIARAPAFLERQGVRDLAALTSRVGQSLTGSAAQTPLARAGSIYAGTIQRMTPEFQFEDGKLTGAKTRDGKTLSAALARSVISEYIEVATEHSGGIFEVMGQLGSTRALKRGFATLARLPEGTPDELMTLLKKGGWHGPVGEMFEERVGDVAHWLNKDQDSPFAPAGQLGIEAVAFSIPEIALRLVPGASRMIRLATHGRGQNPADRHQQLTDAMQEVQQVWERGTDADGVALDPLSRAVVKEAWSTLLTQYNAGKWDEARPDFITRGLTAQPSTTPTEAAAVATEQPQPTLTKRERAAQAQEERRRVNEAARLAKQEGTDIAGTATTEAETAPGTATAVGGTETRRVIRHSDPNIDGGEIIGTASDGRLKVRNNSGGVSLVQDPRRQGNREAAIVRTSSGPPEVAAPSGETEPELVSPETMTPPDATTDMAAQTSEVKPRDTAEEVKEAFNAFGSAAKEAGERRTQELVAKQGYIAFRNPAAAELFATDHPDWSRTEDSDGVKFRPPQVGTVDEQAHDAAHSPTNDLPTPSDAQHEAGNYKKGHIKVAGMDLSVENPEGSERSGVDSNGKPWSIKMASHYGYVRRTEGADGEHVDAYIRPGIESDYDGPVFVVNQTKGNGQFDEHKAMIGWASEAEAKAAYLANYTKGWDRIHSIASYQSPEQFKRWLSLGDTTKPAGATERAVTPLAHAVELVKAGKATADVVKVLRADYSLGEQQAMNLDEKARNSVAPKIVTPQVPPPPQATARTPKEVIEAAGFKYLGEQQMPKGKPPAHMFNVGDHTLMMTGEITPETVEAHVAQHKAKKAPVAPATSPESSPEGRSPIQAGETLAPTGKEEENKARGQQATQPKRPERVPEVRESREPKSPPVAGKTTRVKIPGSDRAYQARYAVREADDVVPSHNPFNFQPEPEYHYLNDRRYDREAQYQTQVIARSKSGGAEAFDPTYVVNNSPTAESGPPIIDADGNVLGGNSRSMIIKRVYGGDDRAAERSYRDALIEQASIFGVDPAKIREMRQPILVREIDDDQLLNNAAIQKAITELNVTSTTPLTQEEQSAAAAGQISDEAAQFITDMIEAEGDDATIAAVMDRKGVAIVNRLIEDGIFVPGDRNRLLKDGKPTPEAKTRVESLLVGSIYRDLAQMQATPPGVRRNIERIVVPMRRVAGTSWDISEDVKNAIDAVIEARATGMGQDFEKLRNQSSMVREPFTDREIDLAKILVMGPVKTAKRFRGYAHDFSEAELGQSLFGAPPTQADSAEFHLGDREAQGALAHRSEQLGFAQEGLVAQDARVTAPRFESPIVNQASALVQKVFGSTSSGRPLLDSIRERGGPDIRTIADALEKNAARFSEQEGQDFARALDKLATLRATKTPVSDFLKQESFFGKELTDEQEWLLSAMDAPAKRATKFITNYVNRLAGRRLTREEIERATEPEPDSQSALFHKTRIATMRELAQPGIKTENLLGNLAQANRNQTFYANPHTLELLRRVNQSISGQHSDPTDGMFIDRAVLELYVGRLNRVAKAYPDRKKEIGALVKLLTTASKESLKNGGAGGVAIIGIFPGDAPLKLRQVIQHERSHEASDSGAQSRPFAERVDVAAIVQHPVSARIFTALVQKFGYADNKPKLIEEAQAWLISKAGVDQLGLTVDEAKSWLRAYFTSFAERNGTESINRWRKIVPAAAKVRDDVYKTITTALPSGSAGSNERPESGRDADVDRRRTRGDGSGSGQALQRRRGEPAEGPRLSTLHNLHASQLKYASDLGGLAVPSLAVVPETMGLRGMGDITLIGDRSLGDPANVPVHDADVWSATFPSPEYSKVSYSTVDDLLKPIKPYIEKFADRVDNQTHEYARERTDPERVISEWRRSNAVKAAFLKEVLGIDTKPKMKFKSVEFKWAGDAEFKEAYRRLWRTIDDYPPEERGDNPELRELTAVARQAIERYVESSTDTKGLREVGFEKDELLNMQGQRWGMKDINWVTNTDEVFPWTMLEYQLGKSIEDIGQKEVDSYATEDALNRKLKKHQLEFADWIENQVMPIFGTPFLKTKQGKVSYSLANIVDYMTGRIRAVQPHLTFGEGKARAAAARNFTDLEQMRKFAARQIQPETEIEEARKDAKTELEKIRLEIVSSYYGEDADYRSQEFGRVWEGLDAYMRAMARWARGAKTEENFLRALSREGFRTRSIQSWTAEEAVEAAKTWLNAPVPYFEAKPQRAVDLSEFSGAVIPKTATSETRELLAKHGIEFFEYNPKKDGAQEAAVVRFRKQLAQTKPDVLYHRQPEGTPEPLAQLFDDEPPVSPFYSRLYRAVEDRMPNRASVEQVRALVTSPRSGVKPEEAKWTGFDDWLGQQKGAVSRAEALAFLRKNEVKVEVVTRGTSKGQDLADGLAERLTMIRVRDYEGNLSLLAGNDYLQDNDWLAFDGPVDDDHYFGTSDGDSSEGNARQEIAINSAATMNEEDEATDTAFSKWVAPGDAENYREMILTLPARLPEGRFSHQMREEMIAELGGAGVPRDNRTFEEQDRYTKATLDLDDLRRLTIFEQSGKDPRPAMTETQIANAQAVRRKLPPAMLAEYEAGHRKGSALEASRATSFKSKHWREENPLAHTRVDERQTVDGKPVLFANDIQSDWMQKRRDQEKKYGKEVADLTDDKVKLRVKELETKQTEIRTRIHDVTEFKRRARQDVQHFEYRIDHRSPTEKESRDYLARQAQAARLRETEYGQDIRKLEIEDRENSNSIEEWRRWAPDGPFYKTWHELVFRQLLRTAAEGGHDYLAWVTGDQAADMFDLSKHVNAIHWQPNELILTVEMPDGEKKQIAKDISAEKLADYIGKENARKIVLPEARDKRNSGFMEVHTLRGDDLKVGEELQGMRGFYDKMLPDYARKLARKFGSQVVDVPMNFKDPNIHQFTVAGAGQGAGKQQWGVYRLSKQLRTENADDDIGEHIGDEIELTLASKVYDDYSAAQREEERLETEASIEKIHAIQITPAMRKSVMTEGQPLFHRPPRQIGTPEDSFAKQFSTPDEDAELPSPESVAGSPDPLITDDDPALVHAMAVSAHARFVTDVTPAPGFEKGRVSARQVIKSFEAALLAQGRPTPIRVGKMGGHARTARGFYKPRQEIIRLKVANNIPTAAHETGHAIQKIIYGDTRGRNLTVPGPVKTELVALGKALYGTRTPSGGYSTEGFAEFIRHYLTTDDAATEAPLTLAFFETRVLPRHPVLAASLQAARKKVDTYRRQGAQNRARANTAGKPTLRERVDRIVDAIRSSPTKMVDEFTPLLRLADAVQALHGPLPLSENPGLAASYLRGTASARVTYMVEDAMVDFAGNPVGKPLADAAAIVKRRQREFTTYLWAKRAQERWHKTKTVTAADGTTTVVADPKDPGMSLEDADAIVAQLETPQFELAAQQVYDWNASVLQYVKEAAPGLAPAIDKILATSDFYVPLARVFEVEEVKKSRRESAGGNPLKKMKGSGRAIKDIFPQMIANAERMIAQAHRKFVVDAIVRLAGMEGVGHLIEEVPKNLVPQSASTEEIIERLEKAGVSVDLSKANLDELMTFFSPAFFPKGQDPIVPFMRDGVMRWYYVHPDLYNTLMGLDIYRLPKVLDLIFGVPTRVFRAGTTGLRAAFALFTNPSRDLQTFLMQTQSHKNPALLAAYWTRSMIAAFSPLRAIGRRDPYLETFYRLGAQLGQPLGIDMAITHKTAKRLFRGKVINTVTSPLNLLQEFLSLPESASRVAEIRALASEVGWKPGQLMTVDQAMQLGLAAKRVTVDFSAAGSVSKIINQAAPFFNAGIQGGRSFARAMRDHPRRSVLRGLLLITIPTLLLWWKIKDEDWYTDMSWRDKFMKWHIPAGEQIIEIPRAFEWGNTFAVVPEAIFDSWYRKDPEGVTATIGHIYETSVPDVLPVVARNAKEQWQNRIEFFDRPIVPRAEIDLPPGEQRSPYTSKVAVWLGKRFPDTISPRRVDALIRGFGGGVAPDVLNLIGLGGQSGTREREPSDLPVIGRAFRRGGKQGLGGKAEDEFYNELNRVRSRAASSDRPETIEQREYRLVLEDSYTAISVLREVQQEIPSLTGRQQVSQVTRDIAKTAKDQSLTAEQRVAKLDEILGRYPALTSKVEEKVIEKKDQAREERSNQPKGRERFDLPGSGSQRAVGGGPPMPRPPTP